MVALLRAINFWRGTTVRGFEAPIWAERRFAAISRNYMHMKSTATL